MMKPKSITAEEALQSEEVKEAGKKAHAALRDFEHVSDEEANKIFYFLII